MTLTEGAVGYLNQAVSAKRIRRVQSAFSRLATQTGRQQGKSLESRGWTVAVNVVVHIAIDETNRDRIKHGPANRKAAHHFLLSR